MMPPCPNRRLRRDAGRLPEEVVAHVVDREPVHLADATAGGGDEDGALADHLRDLRLDQVQAQDVLGDRPPHVRFLHFPAARQPGPVVRLAEEVGDQPGLRAHLALAPGLPDRELEDPGHAGGSHRQEVVLGAGAGQEGGVLLADAGGQVHLGIEVDPDLEDLAEVRIDLEEVVVEFEVAEEDHLDADRQGIGLESARSRGVRRVGVIDVEEVVLEATLELGPRARHGVEVGRIQDQDPPIGPQEGPAADLGEVGSGGLVTERTPADPAEEVPGLGDLLDDHRHVRRLRPLEAVDLIVLDHGVVDVVEEVSLPLLEPGKDFRLLEPGERAGDRLVEDHPRLPAPGLLRRLLERPVEAAEDLPHGLLEPRPAPRGKREEPWALSVVEVLDVAAVGDRVPLQLEGANVPFDEPEGLAVQATEEEVVAGAPHVEAESEGAQGLSVAEDPVVRNHLPRALEVEVLGIATPEEAGGRQPEPAESPPVLAALDHPSSIGGPVPRHRLSHHGKASGSDRELLLELPASPHGPYLGVLPFSEGLRVVLSLAGSPIAILAHGPSHGKYDCISINTATN